MWTRKTQVFLIMKLLGYILFFPKSMLVHITEVKCPMQHEADQRIARSGVIFMAIPSQGHKLKPRPIGEFTDSIRPGCYQYTQKSSPVGDFLPSFPLLSHKQKNS